MDENHENPFYPNVDLGEFRYSAAKYVKLLIRARWKIDPGFLSTAELERWQLSDVKDDTQTESQLLDQAANALAEINTDFIRRCGSGGVKESDESTGNRLRPDE